MSRRSPVSRVPTGNISTESTPSDSLGHWRNSWSGPAACNRAVRLIVNRAGPATGREAEVLIDGAGSHSDPAQTRPERPQSSPAAGGGAHPPGSASFESGGARPRQQRPDPVRASVSTGGLEFIEVAAHGCRTGRMTEMETPRLLRRPGR